MEYVHDRLDNVPADMAKIGLVRIAKIFFDHFVRRKAKEIIVVFVTRLS